jgi:uncharacterized OB-fold protein
MRSRNGDDSRMSIKKCKECRNDVSSEAAACPKCGAVIKKQLTSVDQLGYGVLMIVIIVAVIAGISKLCGV